MQSIQSVSTGKRPIVVTILGARPQFIKAAPVSKALAAADIDEVMIHTGQHFDDNMSELFFRELDIRKPKYNLEINGLSHGAMTGRMLEEIEKILVEEKPDLVVVYGDTNSTLAGGLAASKLHIPIAHVEAGLRSFNRAMPEEINRIVVDHISTLLFCPTATAVDHLNSENIHVGVMHVGDVMMDTTLAAIERASATSDILARFDLQSKHYAVATLHRAENTNDAARFQELINWLDDQPVDKILMPVHPRTRQRLSELKSPARKLVLVEPLGYIDMAWLVHNASAVFTDSGGLQKEAYFHGVPCVTLRDETEWVETIDAGWNRLWNGPEYKSRRSISDYGTGEASSQIAAAIKEFIIRREKTS
ncbi:UDP-N-acetylglucosamine 2-epimerase (non-hydrolyzing) [Hoeflea sp. AS60]|uniref:non-hydrolyzing UDP-N-acetylglucosamine 2-epimerase n=1 Tax=Hoeflea sp. AS60 TaxID=3135780 RepID=UPI00316DE7FB